MNNDELQQFADELVKQIEANEAIWQKGWATGLSDIMPVNHQGTPYRGDNIIHLMMASQKKGFSDNRWFTFNNAKEHGGHVRRGEKGTSIKFYTNTQARNKKDEQGNDILDKDGRPIKEIIHLERPIIKSVTVFNAEQIDGLPPREVKTPLTEWERHEKAENIIKGIEAQGVTIEHRIGDRAYYSPTDDKIVMPEHRQFATPDLYYATVLHEIGHSTGHKNRLNRDLSGAFGSESYAKEELRAEIASMIVGEQLQIGYDPSQHHAYLKSWAKVIKENPKEIFRAVTDANKISDYVIGLGLEIEKNQAERGHINLNKQDIEYLERIQPNFDGAKAENIAHSFNEVREIAKNFTSKEITNIHDGMTAIISKSNLDKMLSNKAHEKSANLHLHLTVVANADKLFENSVLGWKTPYKNDSPDIEAIHRAIAPMKYNNEIYLVKLTIKELTKEQGNRVYSIEAVDIENEKNPVPEMMEEDTKKYGVTPHRLNEAFIDIIVKNAQEYNRNQQKNLEQTNIQPVQYQPQQSRQPNKQPERIYLYTFNDLNDLRKLKEQGVVKFDNQNKVWYAHENNKEAVARWTVRPSVPSPEQEFSDYLTSMGIQVETGHPIFDDKTHRLSNQGSTDKNVMYQAYANPNGVPFARITNFSRGNTPENWQYPTKYLNILRNIEAVERAKGNQYQPNRPTLSVNTPTTPVAPQTPKLTQQQKTEANKAQADLMAKRSQMLVSISQVAPANHNYLNKKQVTANDTVLIVPDSSKLPDEFKPHIMIADTMQQASYLREHNPENKMIVQRGNLIVPQFNTQGELRAFETIGYYGSKYALGNGADKSGLSTTLGQLENGKPIIITEGYATGATLYEHTNKNQKPTVVVAFGRGGLMEVAQNLRANYPDSKIYIGADNDHQKPFEIDPQTGKNKVNQGLEDANKVINSVENTYILLPQFDRNDTGKDWNDIFVDKGYDEFKRQILEQLQRINQPTIAQEQEKQSNIEKPINEAIKPATLDERLSPEIIKQNYPTMPEETIKNIQLWRERLPVQYQDQIKVQFALERLEEKLPSLAQGEYLPPPKPNSPIIQNNPEINGGGGR